ncbi:MAG: hypothetical protein R3F55_23755 [Alphaproteobacteria bacterium]
MTQQWTKAGIRAALVEVFSLVLDMPEAEVADELSPDSCRNWDSLRHIQLCTAIDETFGLSLDVAKQVEILTFDLAVETVAEELGVG